MTHRGPRWTHRGPQSTHRRQKLTPRGPQSTSRGLYSNSVAEVRPLRLKLTLRGPKSASRCPKPTHRDSKSTPRGKKSTHIGQKFYFHRLIIDSQRPKSNCLMPKQTSQMLTIEFHRQNSTSLGKPKNIYSENNILDFTINTKSKTNVKITWTFKGKRDNYCYREKQCI